jgi:hypothetical protein
LAGVAVDLTIGTVNLVGIEARAVRRVALIDCAFIAVAAIDALAEPYAPRVGASARVSVDLTVGAVDLVGIRARGVRPVADIVGAVVVVAAIDVAAELRIFADPRPTHTGKAVEVALGTLWPVLVRARAVCPVAGVFGAVVVVVAIDALA